MTNFIIQFIFAFFATCGFSIIFRVPTKNIPICALIGSCGWLVYQLLDANVFSPVASCFFASCAVALLSDIASKLLKDASTIFIIPGIMCLVPGAGMYRCMLSLLHHDMNDFASIGTETLLIAGSIAVGLLVMGSLIKVLRLGIKKLL